MAGLKPLLKDIADAIRAKSGTAAAIPASEFTTRIGELKSFDSATRAYASGSLFVGSARGYLTIDEIAVSGNSLVLSATAEIVTGTGASGYVSGHKITVTFGS